MGSHGWNAFKGVTILYQILASGKLIDERKEKWREINPAEEEAHMKSISELVKNEEWQNVRSSLVGQWKLKPEWCLRRLRSFLGNLSSTSEDKLRIVLNYLTGSGFRSGNIVGEGITRLREQVKRELAKRRGG